MKSFISLVLLIGGLFLSTANAKVILKDAVVFKVAQTVFSLEDLKEFHVQANNLKCIYPDSIITKIFSEEFSKKKTKLFDFQHPFSEKQKIYFKELVEFAKLLIYSEAQKVVIKPSITKYFYMNAKNSGCSLTGFDEKREMKGRLKELLRLEIFARSRFLPSERSGLVTQDDIEKAIISAKNLLKSIGRQIEDEFYWR